MPAPDSFKLAAAPLRSRSIAVVACVIAVLVLTGVAATGADAAPGHDAASAAKRCKVPRLAKLTLKVAKARLKKAGCGKPIVKREYTTLVKKGRVVRQAPRARTSAKPKARVTVWVSLGKGCAVKKRNKKGKLVTVYLTTVVKKKVRNKQGKLVTKKKRVFVYRYVVKKVRVKGKVRKKRVKVKIPKRAKCKKTSTTPGIPVKVTIVDPSTAHLDFGGFQRDVPLSGTLTGFIVGKGFQLGQDNQIQLSGGSINLAPTGIYIDDDCNGEVSDSIRTDPHSFAELDKGTTGNAVTVAANSTVTGLIHLRIQVALQMRNDDGGCHDPYFTTGWTDFQVPLFIKGKLSATARGLTTTLSTGETVLDQLSACLAVGDPQLPCNGFAIPFPAIFTSQITTLVKIG
jgi:hypothetical protein